jgi:hypothetical protein
LRHATGVREQAKILVFREQDARLRPSEVENDGVLGARADLDHRIHVVTCRECQSFYYTVHFIPSI